MLRTNERTEGGREGGRATPCLSTRSGVPAGPQPVLSEIEGVRVIVEPVSTVLRAPALDQRRCTASPTGYSGSGSTVTCFCPPAASRPARWWPRILPDGGHETAQGRRGPAVVGHLSGVTPLPAMAWDRRTDSPEPTGRVGRRRPFGSPPWPSCSLGTTQVSRRPDRRHCAGQRHCTGRVGQFWSGWTGLSFVVRGLQRSTAAGDHHWPARFQ
jgi:hypothetical protein